MKNPLLVCAHQTRKVWWRVSRPFSLGALALVVDGEGRVLLVELSYRRGWYLPGGGVRKREGLDEAVRRELREEVGVVPAGPLRLQGVYWNKESPADPNRRYLAPPDSLVRGIPADAQHLSRMVNAPHPGAHLVRHALLLKWVDGPRPVACPIIRIDVDRASIWR